MRGQSRGPIGRGQQEAGETGGNAGGVLLGDGRQRRKDQREEEEEASRDRERGKWPVWVFSRQLGEWFGRRLVNRQEKEEEKDRSEGG